MAKDCAVSIRSVNENSATVLVLFERTHGVERDCQVSHEATEPHAVDCVRTHRDSCGLSEVLFKGSSEPASQALIDEMEVERSEEAVVEESPKCIVSVTVQRSESLALIRARVLREKFGRKVDSKSVASSRPERQVALSQTEQRSDEHEIASKEQGM